MFQHRKHFTGVRLDISIFSLIDWQNIGKNILPQNYTCAARHGFVKISKLCRRYTHFIGNLMINFVFKMLLRQLFDPT